METDEKIYSACNNFVLQLLSIAEKNEMIYKNEHGVLSLDGLPVRRILQAVIAALDVRVIGDLCARLNVASDNLVDTIEMAIKNVLTEYFIELSKDQEFAEIVGYCNDKKELTSPWVYAYAMFDIMFAEMEVNEKNQMETYIFELPYRAYFHGVLDWYNLQDKKIFIDDMVGVVADLNLEQWELYMYNYINNKMDDDLRDMERIHILNVRDKLKELLWRGGYRNDK